MKGGHTPMGSKTWFNAGCKDGLYCLVTNGETLIRLATPEDANDVVAILNAMEKDAEFGRQCTQDDCEGAWIAATVHKKTLCEIKDMVLDVASRIGVAAKPEWIRAELERVANLINTWAR